MIKKLINWIRGLVIEDRYEGATFNPSRSYLPAGFQSMRFDAGASTRAELARRARYFERNNAIINRMADLFECYTVGYQLQVMPASSSPEWNDKAKASLDIFFKYADLTSLMGMSSLATLMARTWFVDGEVFVVLTKGSSGRPRIQLIEGHRVATPIHLAGQEGRTVIDGVAVDPNGRPIGYYISSEDSKGQQAFGPMTPADSVIHIFEPSRPNQYRGLTMLYPVLNELHDLDDLHILEMQAAKEAARTMNVIKNRPGEIDPEEHRRNRFSQSQTISTGQSGTDQRSDYYHDVIGGATVVLRTGDEIQQFASTRPGVVTMDYWKYKTELVCSGIGIPYVLVFPETMQGTVYRGALDMANSFFRLRHEVIASVITRICEWYFKWAKANEPALRDAPGDWNIVSIHPPRAVNVDVGRNSAAMLDELRAGATNYELIYAPLGLDWRQQFKNLAEQRAFAASINLELDTSKGRLPSPTVPPPGQPTLEPGVDPVPNY
jgi:lambda family phage portal protein